MEAVAAYRLFRPSRVSDRCPVVAVQSRPVGVACTRRRVHQRGPVRVGIVAIRLFELAGMRDADRMAEFVGDNPLEVVRWIDSVVGSQVVSKTVLRHDVDFAQGDCVFRSAGNPVRCK